MSLQIVASEVVNPYEIDVTLSQIGGCERIKQDLVNLCLLCLHLCSLNPNAVVSRQSAWNTAVAIYAPLLIDAFCECHP